MQRCRWLVLLLIVLSVGACASRAGATPPSPPLDFSLRALESVHADRPTRFEAVATPRIDGGAITIEITPPEDVLLASGPRRLEVARAAAFAPERLESSARIPRGRERRVYVRATLEMPDGTRYTRGGNLVLDAGAPPRPGARLVSDGAGGSLAEYEGKAGAPTLRPASAAGTWTASGQFLYHDREQDLGGFTGVEPNLPARRVDVQVVDATTSAALATGATDGSGNYSILVTDALTRNVRVRMVSLSSATSGLLVDVRNNASARVAYGVNGPTVSGHAPTVDVNFGAVVAAAGAGGEAFNVFDVLLNGSDFFAQLEGARPNLRVTAYWEATSVDGTYFLSGDNSVRLRGGEGYDDTVIGHEHGHFIANHWSKDQSPGGTHYIGDNHQDLRLAWSEGFATWYAAAARRALGVGPRPDTYIDTDGSPGIGNLNFSYSFETPSVPAHGAGCEVAVTACLWDTMDDPATADGTPGVDDDGLAHPVADPWEVIRNYLPQPAVSNVSLEDFWDGWFRPAANHGDLAAMEAAFGALDVRYAVDSGELDGTFAQARDLTPNGPPGERTIYPAGDLDYFRFAGVVGHNYVVETTDDLSGANTLLTVYASDQSTVVAANDDRNANDKTSRVSFVANATAFYYARVAHAADVGVYGSYALRVSDGTTGAVFVDVAAAQGVAHAGSFRGVAWGDVDGDGRPDLFATNLAGPAVLDRNLGGAFVDRASAWAASVPTASEGAAFCDYDKDGDLDLFVSTLGRTYLF
ncbi:MAG: FG-GAP-like repeat-containing protein, partial [Candidatus Eisenbacteria bacterium]